MGQQTFSEVLCVQRHTKKVNLSCHRASHPVRRDPFIYSSPIQKCTKCYVNDEGLSKDTEIAAQWVEKGKVYSKLPRLREVRAGRLSKVIREHVPGTKEALLG